jgi:hypothetical protein
MRAAFVWPTLLDKSDRHRDRWSNTDRLSISLQGRDRCRLGISLGVELSAYPIEPGAVLGELGHD